MNIINYIWNALNYLTNSEPNFDMKINKNIMESFSENESIPSFSPQVKILNIQYSKEKIQLMNIFRFILNSNEISQRVFDLTTEIIKISPSNYEVWVIRRKCLSEIEEINIYNEIECLNEIIIHYPKVYQIWHHRKLIIDALNDCSQEKKFMQKILDADSKNFHCWSHRIWMIRRFDNYEGEFEFINNMLENDVKNNSAWNYRFFLVVYLNGNKINNSIIKNQIIYALNKIKGCPMNESPFNYIMGFINKYNRKYNDFKEEMNELELLYNSERIKNRYNCVFILKLLLEYYEEIKNQIKFNNIIEELIQIDFIRKKYYLWRQNNFNGKKTDKK